jgi:hypothetical protein
MTNGSSLEIVGWPRLVGGLHSVRAYSGVFTMMRWTVLEKVPKVVALWGQLCFIAKSPWRPVRMGWLAPYSHLGPMAIQIRGQSPFHPGVVGSSYGMGCMAPQPFCHWMESIVSISTCRNRRLMVLGYFTLVVAPVPSV